MKKYLKRIEYMVLFILFIFIMCLQQEHVMWLDELDWGVGILINNDSLKDVCLEVLKTGENLPLFYITIYFFKVFFGYNEFLFILESTIICYIGILGLIKISRKYFNEYIEFFAIILISISSFFLSQCALQVRPYALLFCFSAWTLYFYLNRITDENWKNILKYGICMIFLMYSHWFGILISLCYAFIDLILFFRKKVSFKVITSYLIGGLAFLPSFIILLKYHNGDIKEFGVDYPNFFTIYNILNTITNHTYINVFVIISAVIAVIIGALKKKDGYLYIELITFSALILFIGVVVFSFMNPQAALTRDRYFVSILPHITLLLSWFTYKLVIKLKNKKKLNFLIWFIIYDFIFVFLIDFVISIANPNVTGVSKYEGNAKYFSEHEDCYSDKTLIICTYGKTWVRYYFENNGVELPKNIVVEDPLKYPNTLDLSEVNLNNLEYCVKDGKLVDSEKVDDIMQYDTIYYFEQYRLLSKELKEKLFKNYKVELYDDTLNLVKLVK